MFDKNTFANDISIVFTTSPFTIDEFVRPVALPKSSTFQIKAGKTMVSGFGLTEKGTLSKKLKFTQINLRPASFCENLLKNNRKFDAERFLCGVGRQKTAVARRDACQNDSGGPLIAKVLDENHKEKFTLVGIVSSGDGVGEGVFENCGSFGTYTKVSKYLNFIRDPIHNYW